MGGLEFSEHEVYLLLRHLREVVKKNNGLFTVRLTVRGGGGGVNHLGPDRKHM